MGESNPGQNGYINDIHGYNFADRRGGTPTDTDGHGTHVAGIIGAKGNNEEGIAGINWDVSLAWLGVDSGFRGIFLSVTIEALNYANNHDIMITNNSYGGYDFSDIHKQAVANYKGLFVAAAGNSATNNDSTSPFYPASYDLPNIISVASSTQGDNLSSFSCYGRNSVHVAAPGSVIMSTYIDGTYEEMSGTSMAAPQVAGIAALIKAQNPNWSPEQVKAAICHTARPVQSLSSKVVYGGVADAYAALQVDTFFSVTFNLGNEVSNVEMVVSGGKLREPSYPRLNFLGWYTSPTGGSLFDFDTPITQDITLYAQWPEHTNEYAQVFPDIAFCREILKRLNAMDGGDRTSTSIINDQDLTALATITYLDVSDLGIRSLSGLPLLSGLQTLLCNDNLLTDLDVSKLIELQTLRCHENLLTHLNLRYNRALTELSCDNNPITDLDLSQNLQLKTLKSRGLWLRDLDLSNNKELTHLWTHAYKPDGIYFNTIDISKNTKLKELYLADALLPRLDVTNHTELETLHVNGNRLMELDVSNNLKLKNLNCRRNGLDELDLTNNIALEILDVNENNFMAIDISKNTELKDFMCAYNYLTTLDVSANMKLTRLVCAFNYIPEPDIVIGWRELWDNARDILEAPREDTIYRPGDGFWFYQQGTSMPINGSDITDEFIDLSFLAAVREYINKPEGPIYDYDVLRVTGVIEMNHRNIYSLKGIEYFKNLRVLQCVFNDLTELDVSRNTELIFIDVENNQLTKLDVSNNLALRRLYVRNNKLTEIDVSNSPALEDLTFSDNQLTSIDVSSNPALRYLNCRDNQLTELNLSNNPMLEWLSCDGNNLTGLDVSNMYMLDILDCGNNKLTALDVSNNPKLTRIDCSDNQLTTLDISNNPALTWLRCDYNLMDSPDKVIGWQNLFDSPGMVYPFGFYPQSTGPSEITITTQPRAVTNQVEGSINESLIFEVTVEPYRGLDFQWYSNTTPSNSGGNLLFGQTKNRFTIPTTLSAGTHYFYCVVSALGAEDVATSVATVNVLERQENPTDITASFTDPNFLAVVRELIGKPISQPIFDTDVLGITKLSLDHNITSLDGIEHLVSLIELTCLYSQLTTLDISNNHALEVLNLYSNQLTALDVSNNPVLTELNCGANQLTKLDVSNNPALTVLLCGGNQITTLDVSNNPSLTELYCSYNQLTALDISNNPALTILFCEFNQLTTLDVTNNPALEMLRCDRNQMASPDSVVGWRNNFTEAGSKPINDPFCFYPQNEILPIEDVEGFVTRIYHNVLKREPEPDGLAFWVNGLKAGTETASSIIHYFFFGEELLAKQIPNDEFIKIAYFTFMNRDADENGMTHWMNTLASGFNRRYVVDKMILSPEFEEILKEYGIELGPVDGAPGYVARMYRNVFACNYDQEGFAYWLDGFANGTQTGASIAEYFFFGEEFLTRNVSIETFVEIAYAAFMNRDPDPAGFNHWVSALQGGTNPSEVLRDMIASDEFKEICDSYGIEVGQINPAWVAYEDEIFVTIDDEVARDEMIEADDNYEEPEENELEEIETIEAEQEEIDMV